MNPNPEHMMNERHEKGEIEVNKEKPSETEKIENISQQQEEDKSERSHKWKNKEKIRYLIFLSIYKNDLASEDVEKMKMYERLSDCVENTITKTCGNYHLNYLKKFHSIEGIIQYLTMATIYNEEEFRAETKRIMEKVSVYRVQDKMSKRQLLNQIEEMQNKNKIEIKNISFSHEKIHCLVALNIHLENHTLEETKTQTQKTNNHPLYEVSEKKEILETIPQIKVPILILLVIKRRFTLENKNFTEQQEQVNFTVERFKNNSQRLSRLIKKTIFSKSKRLNEDIIKKEDEIRPSPLLGKKKNRWTRFETMKLITLMNIYKENIEYYYHNKKYAFGIKCSEYVNTNKTPQNCHRRMKTLLRKHKLPITKIVEIETERLQISQSLIEKEKLAYFDKENKPSICQISFETKPIEKHIDSDTLAQIIKGTLDYKVQLETEVFLRLKVINQNYVGRISKTTAEKKPEKQQFKNEKAHNPSVQIRNAKEVVEAEVENSLFEKIRKTYKRKSLLNEEDFVLLRKRTVQIINLKKNP